MAIPKATIKQEIKELSAERDRIESQIAALNKLLEVSYPDREKVGNTSNGGAYRGIDINNDILRVFEENDNQPLKVKEIVSRVSKAREDMPSGVIAGKMVYAVRESVGLLKKAGYGKYQAVKFLIQKEEKTSTDN